MKKRIVLYCIVAISTLFILTLGLILHNAHSRAETYRESEEEQEREAREKEGYDKPDGFYKFFQQITTPINERGSTYKTNYAYYELQKAIGQRSKIKAAKLNFSWTQRGPGNVGGRTRSVIIDPDDPTHNTWFAAAVSGGIWKTTNDGQSWQNLTELLPNISTNTMAMAPSNHQIIYVGTGEGYGGYGMVTGNGMYKTINKGNTWEIVESTVDEVNGENFRFVNEIVVDKTNAEIVLAATNTGIFKSLDGGITWDTVYFKGYFVQDLAVNPLNPKTIYAAANGLGILKSYDSGNNWFDAYNGIGTGGRYSLAVSSVDTNYIFTSVEAPNLVTDVYISVDGAGTWRKLNDFDYTFTNFLGNQGWFNNVIKAHPFDKFKVFIGGVYMGRIDFKNSTNISSEQVMRVDTLGTASFIGFINFGGLFLGGGMSTGTEEGADVEAEDYVSVQIRFGPGISQKAYRFTVPAGEGAGVPPEDYTYNNYVTVPFQVWDTKNNRQLMVSFRDQERDGQFNLIERDIDDDISGREYIFIHAVAYNTTPNINITKNGGHYYKMIYYLWPTLPEDKTWNPTALPNANITVEYGAFILQNASTTVLADNTRNENLHVDHHDIAIEVTDLANQQFMIVDANDGGLGFSLNGGMSWEQIMNGYITTQFYGVAKKPGEEEFIGGMQDNGTWQSPMGVASTSGSEYTRRVTGDGFEALWHPDYPERILACTYENIIKLTTNGGKTWVDATNGMKGDGPFITRLSNSVANPNLVFAVGDKGVYRHTNFCVGRFPWNLIELGDGWAVNDLVTSAHNVEVSLADPKYVWAGAGMFGKPDLHVFLSKDFGETFDSVKNYSGREMGYLTGIATHPVDTATAYLLFSMNHRPKILRTSDFGETWEDISGFGNDSTSNSGFPDVMVYSLLVMPYNTDIIWTGTEIGIFESLDNGETWHYADNGLPAVSVWQMFVQDNTIVLATHGRGIWTTTEYPTSIENPDPLPEIQLGTYPNPTTGKVNVTFSSEDRGDLEIRIFDLSGKIVHVEKDLKLSALYQKLVNLSELPPGTYILTITTKENILNSKIVIQ